VEVPQNPYAPPVAAVADFIAPAPGPCPHVELACRLVWASLGLSVLRNVVKIFTTPPGATMVGMIIGGVLGAGIGFAVWSWVTRKLRAGRNWMRWLYTALSVAGWLSLGIFWNFFRAAYGLMSGDWFMILTIVVNSLIGVAVVVLLHTPATREWFRARAAVP
jgi:hypothetical protein